MKPLMNPNPTSFQLYLKQEQGEFAKHWDAENREIRGYKLYWHRDDATAWNATPADRDLDKNRKAEDAFCKQIRPLAPHNHFKATVRFHNLTAIELGALLKVFNLSNEKHDVVFKIGHGKPLGLGSVRIGAVLKLQNETRYQSLFSTHGWNEGEEKTSAEQYMHQFDAYMEEKLGSNKMRYDMAMRELTTIMDWNNTKLNDWNNKVDSMHGNVKSGDVDRRFIERALLPGITEVAK